MSKVEVITISGVPTLELGDLTMNSFRYNTCRGYLGAQKVIHILPCGCNIVNKKSGTGKKEGWALSLFEDSK